MSQILAPSHDEWETPPALFKLLDEEFGFTVDAAASSWNALCPIYISQDMNALVTPWQGFETPGPWDGLSYGAVWCNPPYSMLPAFLKRGYEQSQEFGVPVVMLIPAYTETRYWADFCTKAHEIRFLKGRLAFLEGGKAKSTARFPSALVIFKSIPGTHYGKSPNTWTWDFRCAALPTAKLAS